MKMGEQILETVCYVAGETIEVRRKGENGIRGKGRGRRRKRAKEEGTD